MSDAKAYVPPEPMDLPPVMEVLLWLAPKVGHRYRARVRVPELADEFADVVVGTCEDISVRYNEEHPRGDGFIVLTGRRIAWSDLVSLEEVQ